MTKVPKKPKDKKPKEFKEFRTFISLLDNPNQWGTNFKDKQTLVKFEKNPSDNELIFGYLSRIFECLINILNELRREKTIK